MLTWKKRALQQRGRPGGRGLLLALFPPLTSSKARSRASSRSTILTAETNGVGFCRAKARALLTTAHSSLPEAADIGKHEHLSVICQYLCWVNHKAICWRCSYQGRPPASRYRRNILRPVLGLQCWVHYPLSQQAHGAARGCRPASAPDPSVGHGPPGAAGTLPDAQSPTPCFALQRSRKAVGFESLKLMIKHLAEQKTLKLHLFVSSKRCSKAEPFYVGFRERLKY